MYYDKGQKPINLKVGDFVYIKLVKGVDNSYKFLDNQTKLDFRLNGLYQIIAKVGPLVYKLNLLLQLSKLYNIVIIEHLELYQRDPFYRTVPLLGLIYNRDGIDRYIINYIYAKEIRLVRGKKKREAFYQILYLGYLEREQYLRSILVLDILTILEKFNLEQRKKLEEERKKASIVKTKVVEEIQASTSTQVYYEEFVA